MHGIMVGPIDLRGTEFNTGAVDPAFDEIDFSANLAIVDGGGNAVIVPRLVLEFEVWRGANNR